MIYVLVGMCQITNEQATIAHHVDNLVGNLVRSAIVKPIDSLHFENRLKVMFLAHFSADAFDDSEVSIRFFLLKGIDTKIVRFLLSKTWPAARMTHSPDRRKEHCGQITGP